MTPFNGVERRRTDDTEPKVGGDAPRLLVLDRDGVINRESAEYIKNPDEWTPLPGAIDAIARLNEAGWTVTVATNQSGLGRGMFELQDLYAIHRKMLATMAAQGARVHGVFFCPHTPDDACDCRKPKPGLLRQIGDRFGVKLVGIPFVGDSERDLTAALAVGARPILVRTGNGRKTEKVIDADLGIEVYDDLAAVAEALAPTE